MNKKMIAGIVVVLLLPGIYACKEASKERRGHSATQTETSAVITEQEIFDAQKAWSDGIVKIGRVFLEEGDYIATAKEHINEFYNYQEGPVLFKPTLASEKQFRKDFQGALSYFVGGDIGYPEDHGFAIKPWSSVRWENAGTKIIGNMALAMGNYYFTPADGGDDVKVEYSFAYSKNSDGKLKIILHGSHIPYSPQDTH